MDNVQPEWRPLDQVELQESGCPVCGSDKGTFKHDKRVAGFQLSFWVCDQCDALYSRKRPTIESLRRIFSSKDFFSSGKPGGDNIDYYDFIGGEKFLRKTARGRLGRIAKFCPSGKMLEVASAAGFFLIEAKLAGYDISGVEFSAPMAEYASKRWDVPVVGESIELVELPEATHDVIASWGVMTIVKNPTEVVRKFKRSLKPGGIWAFNTYYHDSLWHRMLGARWQHLGVQISQIYSRKSLMELAKREGFELLSMRRDMPHTDILKLSSELGSALGLQWLPKLVQKAGVKNLIVQVPLPDVYEYIFRKK